MALARRGNAPDPIMQRVGCSRVIQSSRLSKRWYALQVIDFIETHRVPVPACGSDARRVHPDAVRGPKAAIDDLGIHQSITDGVQRQQWISSLSNHGKGLARRWYGQGEGVQARDSTRIEDAAYPQRGRTQGVCADEESRA